MGKGSELTQIKLVDNLKKKIKLEFINLVPEEEWDRLITDTITEFKKKELSNILTQELRNHYQEVVKKYLVEKSTTGNYDEAKHRYALDQGLEKMIIAMAPQILESMISQQIQNALSYLGQKNY